MASLLLQSTQGRALRFVAFGGQLIVPAKRASAMAEGPIPLPQAELGTREPARRVRTDRLEMQCCLDANIDHFRSVTFGDVLFFTPVHSV